MFWSQADFDRRTCKPELDTCRRATFRRKPRSFLPCTPRPYHFSCLYYLIAICMMVLTRPFYCLAGMLPRVVGTTSETFRNKNPSSVLPKQAKGPHGHGIAEHSCR